MQLADAIAQRALNYVATVQRHGHLMGIAEFEAYMRGPGRRPGQPGKGERTVVSTNVERAIVNLAERGLQPMLQGVANLLELEHHQIPATPGVPGERVIDWLSRLGWLEAGEGRVRSRRSAKPSSPTWRPRATRRRCPSTSCSTKTTSWRVEG
jgi:hypothetical protein